MIQSKEIVVALETSDRAKNTSTPYVQLRVNGNSYFNEKAARLLGLIHLDVVRFYRSEAGEWYIGKHPVSGSTVRKNAGLYKFCDVRSVRKVFESFNLKATTVDFPTATNLQSFHFMDASGDLVEIEAIFLNPKYYNVES